MSGIFIMKGLTLGIGAGSRLEFNEAGELQAHFNWQLHFDVAPTWLRIALDHATSAEEQRLKRVAAWAGLDENLKAATLQAEFKDSIQAVVAAATAVDATYASLFQLIAIPPALKESWQKNRTPRFAQVSEVFKRAFALGNKSTAIVYQNVRETYKLRDLAVHPAGVSKPPVWHSEMKVAVEWQFDTYRSKNAALIVAAVSRLYWQLAHNTKPKNPKVQQYAENLKVYLAELFPAGEPAMPGADAQ